MEGPKQENNVRTNLRNLGIGALAVTSIGLGVASLCRGAEPNISDSNSIDLNTDSGLNNPSTQNSHISHDSLAFVVRVGNITKESSAYTFFMMGPSDAVFIRLTVPDEIYEQNTFWLDVKKGDYVYIPGRVEFDPPTPVRQYYPDSDSDPLMSFNLMTARRFSKDEMSLYETISEKNYLPALVTEITPKKEIYVALATLDSTEKNMPCIFVISKVEDPQGLAHVLRIGDVIGLKVKSSTSDKTISQIPSLEGSELFGHIDIKNQ